MSMEIISKKYYTSITLSYDQIRKICYICNEILGDKLVQLWPLNK